MPPGMEVPPIIDNLPELPKGVAGTGPDPPLYVSPWGPGPPRPSGGVGAPAVEVKVTVTGSTSDGYIRSQEATWAQARNTPTNPFRDNWSSIYGLSMQGRLQIGNYWVARAFLYFDLSTLPTGKTIVSATVGVIGYSSALTQVTIQKGTQSDPLTAADFNSFSGSYFSMLTWQKLAGANLNTNLLELDGPGKSYIRQKLGTTAKFCLREYTKDYLDVAPTSPGAANGMYFANHPTATLKPYITIVYK